MTTFSHAIASYVATRNDQAREIFVSHFAEMCAVVDDEIQAEANREDDQLTYDQHNMKIDGREG